MTSLRRFTADDLFSFNTVNLDKLTETYGPPFYFEYLAHWPEYFTVARSTTGYTMGYIMGKAEGDGEDWHGHVTAVSVAPEFRRLGLGEQLMHRLEDISENVHHGYFVDLFVRASNAVAVNMYKKMGYVIYRVVLEYYSASKNDAAEDAYDMRKPLSRDA
eukprot:EG_transcript_38862